MSRKNRAFSKDDLQNLDAAENAATTTDTVPVSEVRRRVSVRNAHLETLIAENEQLRADLETANASLTSVTAERDELKPRAEKAAEYEIREPLVTAGIISPAKQRAIVAEWRASESKATLGEWLKSDGAKNEIVTSLTTVTNTTKTDTKATPPRAPDVTDSSGSKYTLESINAMSNADRVAQHKEINAYLSTLKAG